MATGGAIALRSETSSPPIFNLLSSRHGRGKGHRCGENDGFGVKLCCPSQAPVPRHWRRPAWNCLRVCRATGGIASYHCCGCRASSVHTDSFGKKYVWEDGAPRKDQAFDSWQHFLEYERNRREAEAAGEKVYAGIDGIIVCTQDHTHKEILQAFGPLKLHVLCEKPIATSLQDCQDIYVSLGGANSPERIFSTGHVLRYSPHNMLLRRLLLEDRAIGEVISIEHTEPVGWFHFSHSYVRGNWRKESVAAPSLLCKSCHDINFILWLLCYRTGFGEPAHMPSLVSSVGNLSLFTKHRKPKAAGRH